MSAPRSFSEVTRTVTRVVPTTSRAVVMFGLLLGALGQTGCGNGDPASPNGPVPARPPATLTLAPRELALTVGQAVPLSAIVRDSLGTPLPSQSVSWTSRDAGVASVGSSGTVTAISPGSTWVRATSGTLTDSARVEVEAAAVAPGQVARVELDVASVELEEGDARQLVATPRDSVGAAIPGLGIVWQSSNPGVATVDGSGRVIALRTGATTISARVHGREAQSEVEVTAAYGFDLLFSAARPGGGHELRRMDLRAASASSLSLFHDAYATQAVASPDGYRIAYICANPMMGDPALCIADRDGGGRQLIAYHFGAALLSPTWSPDGTKLAFEYVAHHGAQTTSSRIGVVSADGKSGITTITLDLPGEQFAPAWSPRLAEGEERIVFAHDSTGTGAQRRLWTMRPDGTDRRVLSSGAGGVDTEPAWSPDGRSIAFQRGASPARGSLWLLDVESGVERQLYGPAAAWHRSPAWSPDGRLIAFASAQGTTSQTGQTWDIFTIWTDGTRLARRTEDVGSATRPTWKLRP